MSTNDKLREARDRWMAYAPKVLETQYEYEGTDWSQLAKSLWPHIALELRAALATSEPAPEGSQAAYVGKDGRSHFRVTSGDCVCGWNIINELEWTLHLKREAAQPTGADLEELRRSALEEAAKLIDKRCDSMASSDTLRYFDLENLAEEIRGLSRLAQKGGRG